MPSYITSRGLKTDDADVDPDGLTTYYGGPVDLAELPCGHTMLYSCSFCYCCYQCDHPYFISGLTWFVMCKHKRRKVCTP